jgi:hypothetical protein
MTLDDLDDRLLSTFTACFPRPREIPFCDYDIDRSTMMALCTGNRPYENINLMTTFVCHNRWGMFGDWTYFPAFAGDVAVFCRRHGFNYEYDLLFFYLHTSACGSFDNALFPLLAEWVADILTPWNRQIEREYLFGCEIHMIGYLGIYCNVGGDPAKLIEQNIARSQADLSPTPLIRLINDTFLNKPDLIDRHFKLARRAADNQALPSPDCSVVPVKHVKKIHAAIDAARSAIEDLCII